MTSLPDPLTVEALLEQYDRGAVTPTDVVRAVLDRRDRGDGVVWISTVDESVLLERARSLAADRDGAIDRESTPLYGVPFAVKDSIDVAGLPTTAACPEFAYEPNADARVVERLLDAGALPIGKTNMDQFATGLVGTRSPYGVCRNAIDPEYVAGGSSSGSGVAVASGQVAFALGTDTGGSGRVPAACNGIVGLKPTRGALSTDGVVPACRTLDCVSVFANTCRDALLVEQVAAAHDPADPFSRSRVETASLAFRETVDSPTVGVPRPDQREFLGDDEAAKLFERAIEAFAAVGDAPRVVDARPFLECSELLFEGPWVAERLVPTRELREEDPEALLPVLRTILEDAEQYDAVDAFEAEYERQRLHRGVRELFEAVDVLVTPTIGTVPTVEAVREAPLAVNADLGHYTNPVNLLDLSAVAVPAGRRENGVPFGVTLVAEAFEEARLASLGDAFCRQLGARTGSEGKSYEDLPAPAQLQTASGCGDGHEFRDP